MFIRPLNRRALLGATGIAGITAALAACGGGSGDSSSGGGASGTQMRLALNQT